MKVLIATDAWPPQLNGVVRTQFQLAAQAAKLGAHITFLTPADFRSVQCPGYPEIHLAIPSPRRVARFIEAAKPDYIHVATEGPVGWMARAYCRRRGIKFTSSYHTKFPEYAKEHFGIPERWSYGLVRRFHGASAGTMVATATLAKDLESRGFARLLTWTRGVDADLFRPRPMRLFGSDEPVFLYAGRVSKEKNIEAFLDAELPGRKVVVGDGPHLATLRQSYPNINFAGRKSDVELAECYASADVFVFPSLTDTFGLVILEALASGLPVAAFPVTGPLDILEQGVSGILDENIGRAARLAVDLDRGAARARALAFSWEKTAEVFLGNIRAAHGHSVAAPGQDTQTPAPRDVLSQKPNPTLEPLTNECL